VDDLETEMQRLKNEGFTLLNETPKEGADNKLICFLHPKDTNGVLIELVSEKVDVSKEI
jgi:methylmalonyl-CoA/ethylmalonyl-CoA epimerase